jgi:hypothetical protein
VCWWVSIQSADPKRERNKKNENKKEGRWKERRKRKEEKEKERKKRTNTIVVSPTEVEATDKVVIDEVSAVELVADEDPEALPLELLWTGIVAALVVPLSAVVCCKGDEVEVLSLGLDVDVGDEEVVGILDVALLIEVVRGVEVGVGLEVGGVGVVDVGAAAVQGSQLVMWINKGKKNQR